MAADNRRKRQVKARSSRAKADRGEESEPDIPTPESGRTTERPASAKWSPKGRRSPRERGMGWGFVTVGLIIVVLNYIMEVSDVVLLPGGHMELYFIAGLVIAGFGFWHTGILDATR